MEENKKEELSNTLIEVFKKSTNTKTIKGKIYSKEEEDVRIYLIQQYKELLDNDLLSLIISKLPENYNFEIYKSILRVRELKTQLNRKPRVSLQFPDGFVIYSLFISDILEKFAGCECLIIGDITYGACCIEDLGSKSLNCDLIIHYGHSCLIPVNETCIKVLYVFVDIYVDIEHLSRTIEFNFAEAKKSLVLMGSIQFNDALFLAKKRLEEHGFTNIDIPQSKPRSKGEVLGCTSPTLNLDDYNQNPIVIFVCDGRFHMESAMISNPALTFYQYNPYTKSLSLEKYDIKLLKEIRQSMINKARNAKSVGIIFGMLGRQGNPDILNSIIKILKIKGIEYYVILLSEITEEKLCKFDENECFIQIACPRISIDWGSYFTKPLLTPYEAFVIWGEAEWREIYPMDYYSYDGGEWSNFFFKKPKIKNIKK